MSSDEQKQKSYDQIVKQMEEQKLFMFQQSQANQQLIDFNNLQKDQIIELKQQLVELQAKYENQKIKILEQQKQIQKLEQQQGKQFKNNTQIGKNGEVVQLISLPYGDDVFPILKYATEKMYDHKFWKTSDIKLQKDESFKRFEFQKNVMYESSKRECKYFLIERVYENSKSMFTKLEKEDMMSLSGLMQYNSNQKLEWRAGEESPLIFHPQTTDYLQYTFTWHINSHH